MSKHTEKARTDNISLQLGEAATSAFAGIFNSKKPKKARKPVAKKRAPTADTTETRAPRRTKKPNPELDAMNDLTLAKLAEQKAALERDDEVVIDDDLGKQFPEVTTDGDLGKDFPEVPDLGKPFPEVDDDDLGKDVPEVATPPTRSFAEFQASKRDSARASEPVGELAMIIADAAGEVRSLISKVEAAPRWIQAGAVFSRLKPQLKKQGVKGVTGWQQAITPRTFAISYKNADKLIVIHQRLGQTNRNAAEFPASIDALHFFATHFDELEEFLDEISPATPASELRRLIAAPKPERKSPADKRRIKFEQMLKAFEDADVDTKFEFFHELSAQWGMR